MRDSTSSLNQIKHPRSAPNSSSAPKEIKFSSLFFFCCMASGARFEAVSSSRGFEVYAGVEFLRIHSPSTAFWVCHGSSESTDATRSRHIASVVAVCEPRKNLRLTTASKRPNASKPSTTLASLQLKNSGQP